MPKNTLNVLEIARVCHEANRAYCLVLGDTSQPSWREATDDIRSSAVMGVVFRQQNPDAPPSAQHEQWAKDKIDAGWTYGEVKDAEKKTHPSLVPFERLPIAEQRKDRLFAAVVQALS